MQTAVYKTKTFQPLNSVSSIILNLSLWQKLNSLTTVDQLHDSLDSSRIGKGFYNCNGKLIRLTYTQKSKRKFLSELNADMTSHLFLKNLEYSMYTVQQSFQTIQFKDLYSTISRK